MGQAHLRLTPISPMVGGVSAFTGDDRSMALRIKVFELRRCGEGSRGDPQMAIERRAPDAQRHPWDTIGGFPREVRYG